MHSEKDLSDLFKKYKCCILVPTYNNAPMLLEVLESLAEYTHDIIVVNDGSTDATSKILQDWKVGSVIAHEKNKGKGKALQTGFIHAVSLGYEYAITIDSDGQHYASDLKGFLLALEEHPNAIIIGARNMDRPGIPGKSSFGNKFSNFWFQVETGIKLPDTQSGFRLYPVSKLSKVNYFTNKYEFEIEVLVRAAWKGIEVMCIPIAVYYPPAEERISHFRPFKDFFRISVLNTVLVTIALLWYYPMFYFKKLTGENWKQNWKNVINLEGLSTQKKAASIGLGLFMGIFPVWGYQMLIAALIAHYLKLNKTLTLVASNISIPPMIPFIIYGSLVLGALCLGKPVELPFDHQLNWEVAKTYLYQYLIGSTVLASVAAVAGYVLSFSILSLFKRK